MRKVMQGKFMIDIWRDWKMEIKISVSTNRVGSDDYSIIEIDERDILGMSDEDAENYINDIVVDEIINNGLINWTWGVVD